MAYRLAIGTTHNRAFEHIGAQCNIEGRGRAGIELLGGVPFQCNSYFCTRRHIFELIGTLRISFAGHISRRNHHTAQRGIAILVFDDTAQITICHGDILLGGFANCC